MDVKQSPGISSRPTLEEIYQYVVVDDALNVNRNNQTSNTPQGALTRHPETHSELSAGIGSFITGFQNAFLFRKISSLADLAGNGLARAAGNLFSVLNFLGNLKDAHVRDLRESGGTSNRNLLREHYSSMLGIAGSIAIGSGGAVATAGALTIGGPILAAAVGAASLYGVIKGSSYIKHSVADYYDRLSGPTA
ncbi:MAG: hypothetical protein D6719_07865 [Candidatus Dadabacteria bacterium]|nr:MAG: hypothetical protein D6719_07865 [Candidatus Dadabacteria bacterium]